MADEVKRDSKKEFWQKNAEQIVLSLHETSEKSPYKHTEAFCLMTYRCEKCKRIETIWNSRDGVTSFVVDCRFCDGEMEHVDWELDDPRPDYLPMTGQRVFIDMTPEMYEIYMKVRIRKWWDYGTHPMKAGYATKAKALEALNKAFQLGSPAIITV